MGRGQKSGEQFELGDRNDCLTLGLVIAKGSRRIGEVEPGTVLGGKANPTEAEVTAIIAAGGGKADSEQVKKLIAEFAGKTAEQVIAAGT